MTENIEKNIEKKPFSLRRRKFFITLNTPEKYEILKEYVTRKKTFKALASCLAKGEKKGHEHVHMAVWFKQPITWKQQCGENIEPMISEEGSTTYVGPERQKGFIKYLDQIGMDKIKVKKRTAAEILNMKYDEARNQLTLMQFACYLKLKPVTAPVTVLESYKPDVKVYYLWGKTSTGKTKFIDDTLVVMGKGKEAVDRVRYDGKHFYGQIGWCDEICIFEEFRDWVMKFDDFIQFIDYHANPMRLMYGQKMNTYKLIFISTQQDPETIYSNVDEDKGQIIRRLIIKHFE